MLVQWSVSSSAFNLFPNGFNSKIMVLSFQKNPQNLMVPSSSHMILQLKRLSAFMQSFLFFGQISQMLRLIYNSTAALALVTFLFGHENKHESVSVQDVVSIQEGGLWSLVR